MSAEEQAWEQIMADTKSTSKEVLEKLRCPSCGGILRFLWTPPVTLRGDLDVGCVTCFNGFNKTTDDAPVWANNFEQTVFKTVASDPGEISAD